MPKDAKSIDEYRYITRGQSILDGQPTVRGSRLTVEQVLVQLGAGDSIEDLMKAYPWLTAEDLRACFRWAAGALVTVHLVDQAWRATGIPPPHLANQEPNQ